MPASNRTTDPAADPTRAAGLPEAAEASTPEPEVPKAHPIPSGFLDLDRNHPIAEVVHRRRAQVGGRIRSIRVRPWGEVMTLECVIADETAAITVAFLGRRSIAGVRPGGSLSVEGMVGERNGKLVILNPAYDLRPLRDRM